MSSQSKTRIATIFFLHAFCGSMLHSRIADIQLSAGLDEAQLGLVLMGGPVASMAIFPLISRSIESMGTRAVTLLGFAMMLLSAPLIALASSLPFLTLLWAMNGSGSTLAITSFNVEADRIEAALGRRIMNACHGWWAIGYLAGSSFGGLLRALQFSPLLHLCGLASLLTVVAATVLTSTTAPKRPSAGRTSFRLPGIALLALVAIGLGPELLDGAARLWAPILLRDGFGATVWLQSTAVPAMMLAMAAGRMVMDPIVERHGPPRVARTLLTIAAAGLMLIVWSPGTYLAITGFALCGFGICVVYPLSISAAARLEGAPASQNVATLNLIIQVVMLFAPMATGLVANGFGIRAAFGLFLPFIVLGWLMSGVLEPLQIASKQGKPAPTPPATF